MALDNGETNPMDLLWFSPDRVDAATHLPLNAIFRGVANVAMMRGASRDKTLGFRPWAAQDNHPVYLGIRAGANSVENHHGHLDLGSFVLDADGLRWAIDIPPVGDKPLPPPRYLPDYKLDGYFEIAMNKRFRYYRTSSIGHNTLVIDGQNQPLGVQTEIVAFAVTSGLSIAVVDLTDAYPDCLRVRRGFALINDLHVLIVDEITPKKKISVAWQMHTWARATGGATATLSQLGKRGDVEFFVRLLESGTAVFAVQPAPATPPPEVPSTGVQKLVATFPDITRQTRIAVQLSPESKEVARPSLLDEPLWSWIEWAGKAMKPAKYLL